MATAEITQLTDSIQQVRTCVERLRRTDPGSRAIARLLNDVERLELDADEIGDASQPQETGRREVIYVPDLRSDEAAWMGAQDEGLGFHSRKRTQ